MRLAVFGYAFPHWKTQQFLVKLVCHDIVPLVLIAAPYVDKASPTPESLKAIKPQHTGLVEPKKLCEKLGIWYKEAPHFECGPALRTLGIEIGLIAGAGILPQHIIDSVIKGIINIHPGMIPVCRGLDTIRWSVYLDYPIGNTAHWIDCRIDAGYCITFEPTPVKPTDSWLSLRLRVDEQQVEMLPKVMTMATSPFNNAYGPDLPNTFKYMTPEQESELDLADYIRRNSTKKEAQD